MRPLFNDCCEYTRTHTRLLHPAVVSSSYYFILPPLKVCAVLARESALSLSLALTLLTLYSAPGCAPLRLLFNMACALIGHSLAFIFFGRSPHCFVYARGVIAVLLCCCMRIFDVSNDHFAFYYCNFSTSCFAVYISAPHVYNNYHTLASPLGKRRVCWIL